MPRVLAVVVFALALGATANAGAQSLALPLAGDRHVIGPRVTGDRVVWLREGTDAARVEYATFDGTRARGGRVELPPRLSRHLTLAAAGGRVAIRRLLQSCSIDCAHSAEVVGDAVLLGPLDGPISPVASCQVDCRPCIGSGRFWAVHLAEDALAYRDEGDCTRSRALVRGLDDGHERDIGNVLLQDLRGERLVVADPGGLRVVDWRTGAERYRVPRAAPTYGGRLADNGSIVYTREEEGFEQRLMYATEAEPFDHPLPVTGYVSGAAPAGDAIGYSLQGHVGLITREGAKREVASDPLPPLGTVDGGAGRLAWTARPCGTTYIAIWDVSADPPPLPTRCALPAVLARTARWAPIVRPECAANRAYCSHAFRLPVRCPARPAQGCGGTATVQTRTGRVVGEAWFAVPAGRRGFVDIHQVGPGTLPRLPVRVRLTAGGAGGARVVGVRLAVPRG